MTENDEPDSVELAEERPRGGSGIVFVCDASAEAERLMGAMRNRGYTAVDVPLGLLPTRIRYETPDLIVVDIDAHEAARLVTETRAACPAPFFLVLLGQPDGALHREFELQAEADLVFTRPLEISRTADSLRELMGPPPRASLRPAPLRSSRGPMLVASARRPYRTDIAPSARPLVKPDAFESHWPLTSTPSLGPLLPDVSASWVDPPAHSSRPQTHSSAPPSEGLASLSPETRALLDQARRRVQSYPTSQLSRPSRLSSETGGHGPVAVDLIAVLGEPLGLTEGLPEEQNTHTGDTSGGNTRRGLTRATSEAPLAPASDGLREVEQTNPGGRAPSRLPPDDELDDLSEMARPQTFTLPPLEDLSDLLSQPLLATVSPGASAPASLVDLVEPADSRMSDIPSTAPGGRSKGSAPASLPPDAHEAAEAAPEQDREFEPKPPIEAVAIAIRQRLSGALAQQTQGGVRRLLLRDGDPLTLTSSGETESLVQFLAERGDIAADTATQLRSVPKFGRHAGAALIAQGHLRQEDLWPVLRAHAEWLLGRMLSDSQQMVLDANVPQRHLDEPPVFGGAAGASIYLDVMRRVVHPGAAFERLGAGTRSLGLGAHQALLAEAGLSTELEAQVRGALGQSLLPLRDRAPDLLVVLLALTELGALTAGGGQRPAPRAEELREKSAQMDDEAFVAFVKARRNLVDEGDYFSILGVPRSATPYEIDRARETLRRELAASRLSGRTAHLQADLDLVLSLVDEAHLVLSDDTRRDRYRRALETFPS